MEEINILKIELAASLCNQAKEYINAAINSEQFRPRELDRLINAINHIEHCNNDLKSALKL